VLIGSGPYRLESYSAGEGSYLYTAVDDYFLGRPVVRRIENRPVGDELQALQAGTIDQASDSGLRPAVLEPFRNNPAFEVLKAPPGVSGLGLYWNLDQGGPLADVLFRRACARAINREGIVQRAFGGNGTVGNPGWIPPEHPFHVDVEQYPFDVQAAKGLMEEGGFETPVRYSLLVTNDPVPPVAEVITRQLKEIGVELEIEPVDTPTFNQRVIEGDVEMSIIGSGGMNSDLAPDYLRLIYNSETELTQHAQGYRNPEVDRLTEEQLRTLDRDERMRICARIQQLVAQDLPLLPLFYPASFNLVRKEAFGAWYYTPGGVAGVIPTLQNKHSFITGRKTGIEA
jgi:peptide/nickel transport system substrate-binding protein